MHCTTATMEMRSPLIARVAADENLGAIKATDRTADHILLPPPGATTPLRWSPAKRPVTTERATLGARINGTVEGVEPGSKVLGSPAQLRQNNGSSMRALAPPPPLMPLRPLSVSLKRPNPAVCRGHADRLRARLKVAYYKVRTNQESRCLSELSVNALYCK